MDAGMHKIEVGNRLRLAIEALGLSQAQVARTLGMTPSKLHNYIRGDNYLPHLAIVALGDRYNITADWILRGQVAGMASPLADVLWQAASASSAAPKEGAIQESENVS